MPKYLVEVNLPITVLVDLLKKSLNDFHVHTTHVLQNWQSQKSAAWSKARTGQLVLKVRRLR
jgi:hypothetical protein